jgi:hypothetical protein
MKNEEENAIAANGAVDNLVSRLSRASLNHARHGVAHLAKHEYFFSPHRPASRYVRHQTDTEK